MMVKMNPLQRTPLAKWSPEGDMLQGNRVSAGINKLDVNHPQTSNVLNNHSLIQKNRARPFDCDFSIRIPGHMGEESGNFSSSTTEPFSKAFNSHFSNRAAPKDKQLSVENWKQ